jgi:hypothetical protein
MPRAVHIVSRLVFVVLFSLLMSILLDFLCLDSPRTIERVITPLLGHRCSSLREGMSTHEVLETIDGRFPSHNQALRGNSIEVDDAEGTCTVEIDFSTNKVVKVVRVPAEPSKWDFSGVDVYPDE